MGATECSDAFACGPCRPDSGEPNDAPPGTPLGDVTDEPDVADEFTMFTMHESRQYDYYTFIATDPTGDGDTSSRIRIELRDVDPGQNAELRATLRCGSSGGYTCHEGDYVTNGCESTLPAGNDEAIELTVDCPDSTAEVTVRVWLNGGAFTSCAPYTIARTVR
jgi:hypothetical protein